MLRKHRSVNQSDNPYEPPQELSAVRPVARMTKPQASLLWFLIPAFFANTVGMLLQPRADGRWLAWPIGTAITVTVISAIGAVVALGVYALAGRVWRRSCPATRVSRAMAGVTFAFILWGTVLFVIAVEFKGPPGLISLPLGAIASTAVDRLLAGIASRSSAAHRRG